MSHPWGVLPLLFFFGTAQAQEIPSSPTSPAPSLLPPQSLIGETHEPPKVKPLKAKDIEFEVQVPPGTKVSLPLATRMESDVTLSDYHFRLPTDSKKIQIVIEGPFGGKIQREFSSGRELPALLKISEDRILDSSNTIDPNRLSHLPMLCPRLIPKAQVASNDPVNSVNPLLSPETSLYDGQRDMLSMASLSKNIVLLESATLTFDFEDPSVYVGASSKNGEKLFEKGGGFYSNLNYFIFPFQAGLAELYRQMEPDFLALRSLEAKLRENRSTPAQRRTLEEKLEQHRQALFGKGEQIGPYQVLMKAAFEPNRGAQKNAFSPPSVRGFIPGPFLGSTHWGYTLCEWGDTQDHGSSQKMQYKNYPLWRWPSQSPDEKMILMIVEGDEQLKNTDGRREWIEKGVIRPSDYTDDLVGFFVVSRSETLGEGKILSSPVQELVLKLRTP